MIYAYRGTCSSCNSREQVTSFSFEASPHENHDTEVTAQICLSCAIDAAKILISTETQLRDSLRELLK